MERLVPRDPQELQVFQAVQAAQVLQDKWVLQAFRVLLVLKVLREIMDPQVVSELPVFQVHRVRVDLTAHQALPELRDPTGVLDQLDPLEHLGHLEYQVHLEIRDPWDQLVVPAVRDRLGLMGSREHRVQMERQDPQELRDLPGLKEAVVLLDRRDQLVRSELQANREPMVPRAPLEPPDQLAQRGHLAIREVPDPLVRSEVQVSRVVRVLQDSPDHLVRLASPEQQVHRAVAGLSDLLALWDPSDLQGPQDPPDLWVHQDLPETLGLLVLREM